MLYFLVALIFGLALFFVVHWSTQRHPATRRFRYNQSSDIHISEPKQTMLHNTLAAKNSLHDITRSALNDGERINQLADWAFSLWKLNPGRHSKSDNPLTVISRANNGERFGRTDYNLVLANAMNALGIPTRLTKLCTRDCAWRPIASSTMGIEYFDRDYFKWAWFDGKYGIRVLLDHRPLNVLEIKDAILNDENIHLQPEHSIELKTYLNHLAPFLDIIIAQPMGQLKRYALVPPQLSVPAKKFLIGNKLYDMQCHSPQSFYAAHPIKQLVQPKKTQAIDIRTRKPVLL